MKIKSFAKINLFLKVTNKLKKYHKLYSLILQINLYDEILIKENKSKISNFYFSGPFKIKEKKNTISEVLSLIKKKFSVLKNKNFNFYIKKNIPNGSGLGGASSNAAAVFNFFKKKYKLNISRKESLMFLGKIGKDCPLFIDKKVKLIKSTGEKFEYFNNKIKFKILIIYPNSTLSTKKVFKNLKKISKFKIYKNIKTLKKNDLLNLCRVYGNDLLFPALKIDSKIRDLHKLMNKTNQGCYYSMTGSGSAFFIISDNKKSLLNIKKIIKKQRNSFWTVLAKTI